MRLSLRITPLLIAGFVIGSTLCPPEAAAQGRRERPTGAEIAQQAKKVKFNAGKAVKAVRNGKAITFIPVDNSAAGAAAVGGGYRLMSVGFTPQTDSLAGGQVVGQLDTRQAGDETPLDPGVYTIMVAQVNGAWTSFVESGGQIVGEYTDVEVQAGAGSLDPMITPDWDLKTSVTTAGAGASYAGEPRLVAASWAGGTQTGSLAAVTINKLKGFVFGAAAASNPLDGVLSAAALTPSGLELKTSSALKPAETRVEAQVPDGTGAIKQIVLNLRPSATDPRKVVAEFAGQPAEVAAKLNDPFAGIKFAVKNTATNAASTPFKTTLAKKK